METFFFKKEVPSTPIFLPNGRKLTFDTIDGITGFTFTADPGLASQLFQMAQSGIGGVSPASAEEYENFIKKKPASDSLRKQWREEITPQEVLRVSGSALSVVGAVNAPKPAEAAAAKPAEPAKPFRPKTRSKAS